MSDTGEQLRSCWGKVIPGRASSKDNDVKAEKKRYEEAGMFRK